MIFCKSSLIDISCISIDKNKDLRRLSDENRKKFESVPENAVICPKCRINIDKMPQRDISESRSSDSGDEPYIDHNELIKKLNIALAALDESAIDDTR